MTHQQAVANLRSRLTSQMSEDERTALLKVEQILRRLEQGEGFHVANLVSHKDGRPRLDVSWMGMLAQIEPAQGREIAWMLLEAAAVAECEAFLVRFLKQNVGVTPEAAAGMLADFRQYREQEPTASLVGNKPS